MNNKFDIKETIKFAGTYISVCIGSGFATGQEIMQFFSAYGMISILSSIICMVLLCYCGASLLQMGNKERINSTSDIFTYLCGKNIGKLFKVFMPIFFFCSFIVMISGAGASINQYYGLDKNIGSLIIAIIALISVLMGINKVIDILGNIGPMIAIVSISVGVVTIFRNLEAFYTVDEVIKSINITKAGENWLLTSVIYTGLNLIIATPFLVGVGSTTKNKKSCLWGGILGGVVFMLAAITLNIAIMSDIQNMYIKEIPTLYMARSIGSVVGVMFSLMLIAGIYTTAVPLLWSVCSSFAKENSSKFILVAIITTIIGFIASRLPFSMLVNIIYPLSGLTGVIIMVFIFIRSIKNGIYAIVKLCKGIL